MVIILVEDFLNYHTKIQLNQFQTKGLEESACNFLLILKKIILYRFRYKIFLYFCIANDTIKKDLN